jgi:rhodanese-related sulfurtransferase
MNPREILSTILLCMGFILALLPFSADRSFSVKPQKLLSEVLDEKSNFSVDQVARFIVSEDSTVQIIDLRSREEFMIMNIPGSINIPYSELISRDPESFLDNPEIKNIFYSNGDLNSGYALVFTRGLDYKNIYVMKGGLNEWFNTIMNSSFTGERISARENALFETRTRAEKLFTEMNSLPDSLKIKYIESKHITARKLDGGCE